jgi:hypothetical protein
MTPDTITVEKAAMCGVSIVEGYNPSHGLRRRMRSIIRPSTAIGYTLSFEYKDGLVHLFFIDRNRPVAVAEQSLEDWEICHSTW